MTTLRVETVLPTTPERAFDLALDPEVHVRSAGKTAERVVSRTGEGPLRMDDEITFEARHFGVRLRLTARIVAHERPHRFVDEAVHGPFRRFRHEHTFEAVSEGTRMVDAIEFAAPLAAFGGILVERWILRPHLVRFLRTRAEHLRVLVAEESTGEPRSAGPVS